MHQEIHWLDIPDSRASEVQDGQVQEVLKYKITHQCLFNKAPVYLSNCCISVAQVATQRHLHSAARHQLTIPRHRLSTYGRRAFSVAGLTMFNALPDDL